MVVESITLHFETSGGVVMPFFLPAKLAKMYGLVDGATVERRELPTLNAKKTLFMMGFVEKIHTVSVDFIAGLAKSLSPEDYAKLLNQLQGGHSENEID